MKQQFELTHRRTHIPTHTCVNTRTPAPSRTQYKTNIHLTYAKLKWSLKFYDYIMKYSSMSWSVLYFKNEKKRTLQMGYLLVW